MIINIDTRRPSGSSIASLPPILAEIGGSEVALIELQGELEVEGDKSGQVAAKLTLDPEGKRKPTLRVGHHLLDGKIVNLTKPLAVLEKKRREDSELEDSPGAISTPPSYSVRAIVRKKIVFSKRPMPIVAVGNALAA